LVHTRWSGLRCGARIPARRFVAGAALSLAMLLAGGVASAQAGPGVTIRQGAGSATTTISGGQIAGAANAGGTYTLRDRPGDPGERLSLRGVSIRGLLELAGFNAGAVRFVQVVGADGSVITVTGPEINNPPFPDGPAIVTDEGPNTRFVKPALSSGGTSDNVLSVPGTPLEMTVEGGSLLSIRASASPTTVRTGQTVTFHASVRFPPPGASYTYTWDFDDGGSGTGPAVTHTYNVSGDLQPRITVRGTGGSTAQCASLCEGTETVDVTITGKTRDGPLGTAQGGGGAESLGGTGTGGTGSGTGSGGGGTDDTAFGAYPPAPKVKPKPQRAERPEPHLPFSSDPASGTGKTIVQGILLSGSGKAIESALSKGAPAGNPKPQKGEAGVPSDPSRVGFAVGLALTIMWLGALQERRRVRLRVA
jgi:hypothetical protein